MVTQPATRTKKTSKQQKKHIGLKIILSIGILIIAVLAVLPFFINPIADSLVKQQVAAKFGNKLKIGSVTVSFLTGAVVKVNQIELAEAPGYGNGSLVKAGSINIRVALMPLLKKQLIVHDITIVRPDIHIIQYRNGNMNLDYYLSKFTGRPTASTSSDQGFVIKLNQFNLKNGRIIFSSYAISEQHQPTFVLTNSYLNLKNLVIPNLDKIATHFSFSCLLGTSHPAQIKAEGSGVLGGSTISFAARSKISNLTLADYAYLVPNSTFTIKSGRAWVTSNANCRNNYLNSYHHVDIKNLQLAPKKGHALDGTLLGVPANMFMKGLQDGKGMLNFDFTLSGRLDDLKANAKFQIINAITKSLHDKLGLGKIGGSGVKKVSNSVVKVFKGMFKRKKQ